MKLVDLTEFLEKFSLRRQPDDVGCENQLAVLGNDARGISELAVEVKLDPKHTRGRDEKCKEREHLRKGNKSRARLLVSLLIRLLSLLISLLSLLISLLSLLISLLSSLLSLLSSLLNSLLSLLSRLTCSACSAACSACSAACSVCSAACSACSAACSARQPPRVHVAALSSSSSSSF